jgi:mannose-6-phosphate isomerase-like protein (cupin superfamily)
MAAQPDRAAAPVVGIREDYEATEGPFHRHQRAQLVYSVSGVTTVTTETGIFVVPPERAVWVRGGERHRVTARRPIQLRTLYFDEARMKGPSET